MNLPPSLSATIQLPVSSSSSLLSTPMICKADLTSNRMVDDDNAMALSNQQKQALSFLTPVKQAPKKSSSARFDSTFAKSPSCTTDGLPNHLVRVSSEDYSAKGKAGPSPAASPSQGSNRSQKSSPKSNKLQRTKSAPIRPGRRDDDIGRRRRSKSKNANKKWNGNSSLSSLPSVTPETKGDSMSSSDASAWPLQSFMSQLTADKESYCAGNKVDIIISLDNARLSPPPSVERSKGTPRRHNSAPLRSKDGKIIPTKRHDRSTTSRTSDDLSIPSTPTRDVVNATVSSTTTGSSNILSILESVPSILKNRSPQPNAHSPPSILKIKSTIPNTHSPPASLLPKEREDRDHQMTLPTRNELSDAELAREFSIKRGIERSKSAPVKPRRFGSYEHFNGDSKGPTPTHCETIVELSNNSGNNSGASKSSATDTPPALPRQAREGLDVISRNIPSKDTRAKTTTNFFDDNASVETIQRDNTSRRTTVSRRFQADESSSKKSPRQEQQVLHVVPSDKPPGLPVRVTRRTKSAPLRKSSKEDTNKQGTSYKGANSKSGGDAKVVQDYIDRFILKSPKNSPKDSPKKPEKGDSRWDTTSDVFKVTNSKSVEDKNTIDKKDSKSEIATGRIETSRNQNVIIAKEAMNRFLLTKSPVNPKNTLSRWNTAG